MVKSFGIQVKIDLYGFCYEGEAPPLAYFIVEWVLSSGFGTFLSELIAYCSR